MKKFFKILFISVLLIILFGILSYAIFIPKLVNNRNFVSIAQKALSKALNLDIYIDSPHLETGFSGNIIFKVEMLSIDKDGWEILSLQKFNTKFSISQILKKKIVIERIGARTIFADFNKLTSIFGDNKEEQTKKENDWNIDLYDAVMFLKDGYFIYNINPKTTAKIHAEKILVDNSIKTQRAIHFNFNADIIKDDKTVNIKFSDDNKFIIGDKKVVVLGCPLSINNSKIFFNAEASRSKGYNIEIYGKKFLLSDVIKLLDTQIIENNIDETLAFFKDIKGDFDFNVILKNNDINGNIKINKLSSILIPMADMPFLIKSGNIDLTSNNLILSDFEGYYSNNKNNDFKFKGHVNDYLNSMDTEILSVTALTNDLFEKYISKISGTKLTLKGQSRALIKINAKNNIFDIKMAGKIKKGDDILVEGSSLSPIDKERALGAELYIDQDIVNIKNIDYYIADVISRETRGKIKPILNLNGNYRISDGRILNLGFNIPSPLPSEFLNVIVGQQLFKRGTFSGNMEYLNARDIPKIRGELYAQKVFIPSQRMYLRKGEITTDRNLVKIKAEGKYRRSDYTFSGNISNEILFPIVVKNTNLTIDNLDVERVMQVFNAPVQTKEQMQDAYNTINEETQAIDNLQTFDIKNIIIEEGTIKILKGKYKEVDFGNINAGFSLDKKGVLKLKSNRFDIAKGHSSANINCDLVNQNYNIKLGIKDVDSDIISSSVLNLNKEISGLASGFMNLNTDSSLKLNGEIKFSIKDGTIQKIGLVQYILKFAALFRNPLVMISPSTVADLINIPEGKFDKITGELKIKDNKILPMKIKSSSPQLSTYIIGSYNMENNDASLHIYTKFSNKNKGIGGFLRNISLNSIANRIYSNRRNDVNYYSSELEQLPEINADEKDCQVFLTIVDGDIEHNNFVSSLKKIK